MFSKSGFYHTLWAGVGHNPEDAVSPWEVGGYVGLQKVGENMQEVGENMQKVDERISDLTLVQLLSNRQREAVFNQNQNKVTDPTS